MWEPSPGSTPALQPRHPHLPHAFWPRAADSSRSGWHQHLSTPNPRSRGADSRGWTSGFDTARGGGPKGPPHLQQTGGGANLRGCPSLTPPPSGPPRLPWPRARPGKALFCQREPSECAEKSHPALMRVHTALQRRGGLPGGRGRGARAGAAGGVCGGPVGPESPPVWLLIARFLPLRRQAGAGGRAQRRRLGG